MYWIYAHVGEKNNFINGSENINRKAMQVLFHYCSLHDVFIVIVMGAQKVVFGKMKMLTLMEFYWLQFNHMENVQISDNVISSYKKWESDHKNIENVQMQTAENHKFYNSIICYWFSSFFPFGALKSWTTMMMMIY